MERAPRRCHTAHIYGELLKRMTGIQMVHVPYKGSPPALNDIVGGHIQLMFGDALPSLPLIAEGKVRALAVSSGMRLPSAPDIPTIAETGVHGFDAAAWIMVVAPVKTSMEIVGRLRSQLITTLAAPDVQSWINSNGMIPAKSQTPEDLQRFMGSEQARWRGVLEKMGIAGRSRCLTCHNLSANAAQQPNSKQLECSVEDPSHWLRLVPSPWAALFLADRLLLGVC